MQKFKEIINHVRVIIHLHIIAEIPVTVQHTITGNREVTIRVIQEANHHTIIREAIKVILRLVDITEIMQLVWPVIHMEELKEARKPGMIL